jgi:hypothetical protein
MLVSFRGRALAAQVDARVQSGEEYRFQVKSSGNRVVLGVLQEAGKREPALTGRSNQGENLAVLLRDLAAFRPPHDLGPRANHLLQHLERLTPALIYSGPGEVPGNWFSRFFASSGLFWEGKVAKYLLAGGKGPWKNVPGDDLKGALLELRGALREESPGDPTLEGLRQKVDETLRLVEVQQAGNLSVPGEEGGWFCFIPAYPEEGLVQADLFCTRKGGSKEVRFALHLEFTSLGAVDVSASVLDSSLAVHFQAADEARARWITDSLPLLEEALKEMGIGTRSMRCTVQGEASEGPGPFEAGEGSAASLDVVI